MAPVTYSDEHLEASNVIVHGSGPPPDAPLSGPDPRDSKRIAPVSVPDQAGTYSRRLSMFGFDPKH